MIKANELRIGNYLIFNGAPARIGAGGILLINENRLQEAGNPTPIPLTPEILENLQPWQLRKIEDLLIENSFPLTVKQTYKKIETLHGLQNFYFFATDEELMVNELEYAKMKNNEI
jgi:hypothetical protein